MQRNAHFKPKSSVYNVHSNKSKEVDVSKQVMLNPPLNFSFSLPQPSHSIKPNADNENIETHNENKIDDDIQIELAIETNHCLSPKLKSEGNDLENFPEASICGNEEVRVKPEPFIDPKKSEISSIIYYSSFSEDEVKNQLKKGTDVVFSSLDDKFGESKISGTYFDINKLQSDMKKLMPTSTNINNDLFQNTESFILDQQIEIEVTKINEAVTDDVYEFKETESSISGTISSVAEEKLCRSIRHDSPNLYNSKKPNELQRVIDSPAKEEVVDQNRSTMIQFVPNSNIIYSFDNNNKIKVNDNMSMVSDLGEPILLIQSHHEYNEFQNLMIREVMVDKPNIKEIDQFFQDEVNVSDLQYEVLDLCMKPPESPHANIFSIPKHYELNDVIEYNIYKPSTSKGFFDSIYQPGTNKDSFYQTDTSRNAKNSFFEASQAFKSVIFDTNVPGKSSLFDLNIPSCSTKNFYDYNIPSTSNSNLYENYLPSTSKSFYNFEYDVNNVLICKETIPGSPTGMSEEQYDQEERKNALQVSDEEREAALAICTMNQSFCRLMITMMGATEEKIKEYTNILQK